MNMLFDPRKAKLLQAGDHMTVPLAPGLRLEASTVGRAWTYRYKSPVDGRMRQVKLGTWPAMSAAQAAVEWERLRVLREAGRDPARERRTERHAKQAAAAEELELERRGPYTVGRLLDEYMAHAAPKRAPKGAYELRRTLDTGAASLRERMPAAITRSVAYDLIETYAQTAPVQAQNLRRELGAAWEWGHDSGRLADDVPNWWRQVLRGKIKSRGKVIGGEHVGVGKRVLTLNEVGEVLRMLPHCTQLIRDLLTLYLWAGCRGAELVQMEGVEITEETDGWWWTLPRGKLKLRAHPLLTDLRVPLVGRALELVRARMDVHGAGHLFPGLRAPHVDQKVVGVAVWWHRADNETRDDSPRARWPIPAWTPHDLRRTVRTHLAALGCPSEVAEAILGHIQPGVEGVYNRHDYDAERRRWLTLLAQRWEKAAVR